MLGDNEIARRAKVVALNDGSAFGDHFAVEITPAQADGVAGVLQVCVPPIQVDGGFVVEDVQWKGAGAAPLDQCVRRFESFVDTIHGAMIPRVADRNSSDAQVTEMEPDTRGTLRS